MFNLNRPRRRSFDDWIADLQALSGQRDVSTEDAQVQDAFAADPKYTMLEDSGIVELSESELRMRYAAAECADGRADENDPSGVNC